MKKKIADHMREYKLDHVVTKGKIENSIIVAPFNPHEMSDAKDMLKALGI